MSIGQRSASYLFSLSFTIGILFLLLALYFCTHAIVICSACSVSLGLESPELRNLPTGVEIDRPVKRLGDYEARPVEEQIRVPYAGVAAMTAPAAAGPPEGKEVEGSQGAADGEKGKGSKEGTTSKGGGKAGGKGGKAGEKGGEEGKQTPAQLMERAQLRVESGPLAGTYGGFHDDPYERELRAGADLPPATFIPRAGEREGDATREQPPGTAGYAGTATAGPVGAVSGPARGGAEWHSARPDDAYLRHFAPDSLEDYYEFDAAGQPRPRHGHLDVYRVLQRHWQVYDAYARVCMLVGTLFVLKVFAVWHVFIMARTGQLVMAFGVCAGWERVVFVRKSLSETFP